MEHDGATIFHLLERSGFGMLIRDAVMIYPVANVVHVLAVLVFFASVAVMDLRLLGWLSDETPEAVMRRFRPVAIAAFLTLLASGIVLFTPEASAIIRNPSFQLKLALIALGLANVWWLGRAMRGAKPGTVPGGARFAASASLLIWLGTAAAGRYIAYI